MKRPILIVAGPTGSGKTQLALDLTTALQKKGSESELVYADSIAIYRRFDIGSAKPDEAERALVPHHLIDVCEPDADFTAADYCRAADQAIVEIDSRNRLPVVVGGTGFYIRALLRGMIDQKTIGCNEKLRAELTERMKNEGSQKLFREMIVKDPPLIEKIHPNDEYRIIRALEAMAETGRKWSELNAEALSRPDRYENHFFCIDIDRDVLKERVTQRTRAMLDNGIIAEIENLLADGYSTELKPLQSVGYRQCLEYLGKVEVDNEQRRLKTREELEQAIVQGTMRLAKNQRTWFKSERNVTMLKAGTNGENLVQEIMRVLGY